MTAIVQKVLSQLPCRLVFVLSTCYKALFSVLGSVCGTLYIYASHIALTKL